MTEAPTTPSSEPVGPPPLALAMALDLVTGYRLRLADRHDSRLGPLVGAFDLSAVAWTGDHARLVGFYTPALDPATATTDLAARMEATNAWASERRRLQSADRCDTLLVALGTVVAPPTPPPLAEGVSIGVLAVDPATGRVDTLFKGPSSLPSARDVARHERSLREGTAPPTLAAVDLAERQAMAAAGRSPRGSVIETPVLTYGLIGVFVAVWLAGRAVLGHVVPPGQPLGGYSGILGASLNDAAGRAEWWRYVSASFLHDPDTIQHVALNCWATYIIGRTVEQIYGRLVMLGSFLVTGATGALLWVGATGFSTTLTSSGVSLGASAGICGWMGLLVMLGRFQGRNAPPSMAASIRQWVGINLVLLVGFGLISSTVNNWAHAGGFAGGAALGLVVPPVLAMGGRALRRIEQVALIAVVVASVIAIGIAAAHAADAYGSAVPLGLLR